jgi:hypothetical protein
MELISPRWQGRGRGNKCSGLATSEGDQRFYNFSIAEDLHTGSPVVELAIELDDILRVAAVDDGFPGRNRAAYMERASLSGQL